MRAARSWAAYVGTTLALIAGIVSGPIAQARADGPSGHLSGTVQDSSGTPIPDALVEVLTPGTSTIVADDTSATDGTYSITVDPGTYDVTVVPNSASLFAGKTVSFQQVGNASTLNIVLVPGGTSRFFGVLVDDHDNPVPNVNMSLGSASTATGADGSFSMYVTNGTYALDLNYYFGPVGSIDMPDDWYLNTAPTIAINSDVNLGHLALPSPAHLSTTVIDPNNNPVPGARVYPNQSSIKPGFGTLAGAQIDGGTSQPFSRGTNSAGIAVLNYWPTTNTNGLTVIPPATAPLATATVPNFDLEADTSESVSLPTAYHFFGVLVDDHDNPVPNVNMSLGSASTATGADGSFSMYVTNGTYALDLNYYFGPVGSIDMPDDWYLNTAPTIAINSDVNLGHLALPSPAHLSTTVIDPNNNPVPGARVYPNQSSIKPGFGTLAGAQIDGGTSQPFSRGTNSAGIAVLNYWPTTNTNGLTVIPPATAPLATATVPNFDLEADTSESVSLPTAYHFFGVLVDDHDNPVPNVNMSLGSASTATGADGSFSMYVTNGTYALDLNYYFGPVGSIDMPDDWYLNTAPTIAINSDVNLGHLALPSPAHLSTTVIDPNNNPVPGARVYPNQSSIKPGFGTLAGAQIDGGTSQPFSRGTNSAGIAVLNYWPTTNTNGLTVIPPATAPLATATVPNFDLEADTSLLLAYQTGGGAVVALRGVSDTYSTFENSSLTVVKPGVLVNDVRLAGTTLASDLISGPSNGSLTFNADGSFVYTPDAGFVGKDSFTYQDSDGTHTSGSVPVTITVTPPPLTSITVTPATTTLLPGQTQQLTATGTYSDSSTADLTAPSTWSTSDGSVATVNGAGLVTAVGGGTATITATDAGVSSTATITVRQPAANVTWGSPATITYGTALSATQLNATASVPGTFSYTPSAGTVLGAGSNQTLSVTFTPQDNSYPAVTKTTTVNVTKALLTVTASDRTRVAGTANPALTYSVTGFVNGDTASSVTGTPSLTTTAVTNSPAGSYPISVDVSLLAAANYAFTGVSGTLTVTAPVVTSIAVTPATPSISAGAKQQFTATATYNNGASTNVTATAAWSSSATNVATVSSVGLASGLARGTTTISATLGTVQASATLTVTDVPVIAPIAAITATATSPTGVAVNVTATASDPVDGTVPVTCTPGLPGTFPVGVTHVTCQATNRAGVSATPVTTTVTVAAATCQTGNFSGNQVVKSGQVLCLSNANVSGNITVQSGGALWLTSTNVAGAITSTGAKFVSLCGAAIAGPVTVTNSAGYVLIGDVGGSTTCAANTISGPVQLTGNSGGIDLSSNQISGTATISSNTNATYVAGLPTLQVAANRVSGALGGTGNNPAPTNAGKANMAATKSGQFIGL